MHLTEDQRRRLKLLEWLFDLGSGKHLAAEFYGDSETAFRVSFDDLTRLNEADLVNNEFQGGGVRFAEITAKGREEVEQVRRQRDDQGYRRMACRQALLQWLDSQGAHPDGSLAPTWDGFFIDFRSDFFGEPFTPEEVHRAADWLYQQGLINGTTAEEEVGPVRSYLTATGLDLIDTKDGDVRNILIGRTDSPPYSGVPEPEASKDPTIFDVFICHASEDKVVVASPLAAELRNRGARVWIDETELMIGDSLRRAIDSGLTKCRFGVVVLSPSFFKKEWPQWELDGLAQREMVGGRVVILPVLHGMTNEELAKHSPLLAARLAAFWSEGAMKVADQIQRRLSWLPPGPAEAEWAELGKSDGSASERNEASAVVQKAKEYLSANNRVGLHDLVAANLRSAKTQIETWPFGGNRADLIALVERIDTSTELVTSLVATYAYYGDTTTDKLWLPALKEWAAQPAVGGITAFINLLYYPATRLLYAGGIAMVAGNRLADIERLMRTTVPVYTSGKNGPVSSELHARRSLSGLVERTPVDVTSKHVFDLLGPMLETHLLLSPASVERSYELFELLLFLVSIDSNNAGLDATNLSMGQIRRGGTTFAPRARLAEEIDEMWDGDNHPWMLAGLFGSDAKRFRSLMETFNQYFAATHPGLFG